MTGCNAAVTVAVLSYNNSRWIEECLESILTQGSASPRLVVIDDGSTDDSHMLIKDWAAKNWPDAGLYLHHENRGLVARANEALNLVDTEFYHLLASDDALVPGKLEKQLAMMRRYDGAALCFTDAELVDELGDRIAASQSESVQEKGGPAPSSMDAASLLLQGAPFCAPTWLIRTICARAVGGYDERFQQEDVPMFLKLATSYPVCQLDEPLVRYRRHSASLSRSGIPNTAESIVGWCDLLADTRDGVGDDSAWLPQYRRRAYQVVFTPQSSVRRVDRVRCARLLVSADRGTLKSRFKAALPLVFATTGAGRLAGRLQGSVRNGRRSSK